MIKNPAALDYFDWLQNLAVTEGQVQTALVEREHKLLELKRTGVRTQFSAKKIFTGSLSRGCQACGAGTWSCLFLNHQCTAACFFCPGTSTGLIQPQASRISFPSLQPYLDFLRANRFEGLSFSGGEPLLSLGKVLKWTKAIRENFGSDIYLWLYTNGDLLDRAALDGLERAGIDEIRINICARGYDLSAVTRARSYPRSLTVEIPAIPDDLHILKDILPALKAIGVDHLNLHQLHVNKNNFKALSRRNYRFLAPNLESGVWESELAALELIRYSLDHGLELPIHYCALDYKRHYQDAGLRRMAGKWLLGKTETLTAAGYIRRISIHLEAKDIQDLAASLASKHLHPTKWKILPDREAIYIHPDLLVLPEIRSRYLTFQYLDSEFTTTSNLGTDIYDRVETLPGSTGFHGLSACWPTCQVSGVPAGDYGSWLDRIHSCLRPSVPVTPPTWMAEVLPYEVIPPGLETLRPGNPWRDLDG